MTTEVSSLTLELPKRRTFAYLEAGPDDDKLPKVLGPGQSASLSYLVKGLSITLSQMDSKPKWLRAKAVSGHKTVKGKKDRKMAKSLSKRSVDR